MDSARLAMDSCDSPISGMHGRRTMLIGALEEKIRIRRDDNVERESGESQVGLAGLRFVDQ